MKNTKFKFRIVGILCLLFMMAGILFILLPVRVHATEDGSEPYSGSPEADLLGSRDLRAHAVGVGAYVKVADGARNEVQIVGNDGRGERQPYRDSAAVKGVV